MKFISLFTKYDKILICLCLLTALIFYILFGCIFSLGSASMVRITVDGQVYGEYALADKTVDVKTEFGHNTIEITKDGAYVSFADCPDKIDVKSGKISKPGQIIICVPNRLSVQMIDEKSNVDGVVY